MLYAHALWCYFSSKNNLISHNKSGFSPECSTINQVLLFNIKIFKKKLKNI